MLQILQENLTEAERKSKTSFTYADADSPNFRNKYAEYLLGEVKDHLLFYYSSKEYELFLKFFEYLDGRTKFSYGDFTGAFKKLQSHVEATKQATPPFMTSPDDFLQFLYDVNVICFFEPKEDGGKSFIRWCFQERSYSNISPKVRTHGDYEIHYGLARALNTGRRLKAPRAY